MNRQIPTEPSLSNHLADCLAVGKLPDLTRDGIRIWDGIEVNVLECLGYQRAILWVVAHLRQLNCVDVLVEV